MAQAPRSIRWRVEENILSSGRLLRQLIKTGSEGNVEAFRQFSQQVIDEERGKQHHLLANDLERILYGQGKASSHVRSLGVKSPEDRSNGVPLFWIGTPTRELGDLVFDAQQTASLERIIEQYDKEGMLAAYGLRPDTKVLFHGPPGTGKTVTAEALAFRLERPIAIMRLDSLISSYLGETASNLERVFNFLESQEVVALFDEFDAIARERSAMDDHGELKRVVNAVLQMMDRYAGKSLIIAATNHEQTLDYAVWRRFDEVLRFPLPDPHSRRAFLARRLSGMRLDFDLTELDIDVLTSEWSFADLQRFVVRLYKDGLLRQTEFLDRWTFEQAIQRETDRIRRTSPAG
jgi:AAA+ superfamily predicted ATPase